MSAVSSCLQEEAWTTICSSNDLVSNVGVCALLEEEQVAIFKFSGNDEVYAISNHDPFSDANVLSRGIIGDIDNQPVVASPIYKQHFNLQTGECIEDKSVKLSVYNIRIIDDEVQVSRRNGTG